MVASNVAIEQLRNKHLVVRQVNGYGGKSLWGMTDDNADALSEINNMFVQQGVGLWIWD